MATFVLVHGACHGAWCWFRLTPELEARGHRVVTLDLPALGDDDTPVSEVTFDGTIDRAVGIVEREAGPVILVGHSLGGVSISATAERIPEKIRLLVYLSAFLPLDGETVDGLYTAPGWPPEPVAIPPVRSADGLSFWHTPEGARARFYQDCSEEDVTWCLARLKPQPAVMRRTPVRVSAERFGSVPRAFIQCTEDRAAPIERQRRMVERSPCKFVAALPTGHSPFLSAPKELADILDGFARRA